MVIPGPLILFVNVSWNRKAVLSGPVLPAPVTEVPVMVSCSVTQLRFPMAGLNCWNEKLSVLAVVGDIVIDWSIAVAGIPPVQRHCANIDGWRNIITHAKTSNPLK